MISGYQFTYNGISSASYGLLFANLQTSENTVLGGDLIHTTFQNRISPRNFISSISHSSPLELDFEMFTGTLITDANFIIICNWLNNSGQYKKLTLNNNTEYSGYYFNCYFTNLNRFESANGEWGKYGISGKMILDSNYIWENSPSPTINTTFPFVYNNTSMQPGYTYPTVVITVGVTGGNISLQNVTDNNRLTTILNTTPNEIITLSANPFKISSSLSINRYGDMNKHWLRLLQGNNSIGKVGDIVSVSISYEKAKLLI